MLANEVEPVIPPAIRRNSDANSDQHIGVLSQRLQQLRKQHALSLQQVALRSGLSVGTLSQVERGLSQPSLRTVQKLASAYGLPTTYFFDGGAAQEADADSIVTRAGEGAVMSLGKSGMTKHLMSPASLQGLQFMHVSLKPGGMSGERTYTHAGVDVGYVVSGTLNLEVEGRFFVLSAGDSFCFDSQRPHRFDNRGSVETVIIYVNTQ